MQATLHRRPRAPRALAWLVLAAHLAGLVLVGQALRPHERGGTAAAPRPLWLRLLREPKSPAPAPASQESRPQRPAGLRPARIDIASPRPPIPAAPAPPAEAITLPPAERPTSARAPEPPASVPLDLRAPPSLRQAPPPAAAMARDDPRANTSRLGSEERMARTLGTDLTLRESADPDGTRYFRRGSDCVVARPARIGQLHPMDQAAHPTPRLVDKC